MKNLIDTNCIYKKQTQIGKKRIIGTKIGYLSIIRER